MHPPVDLLKGAAAAAAAPEASSVALAGMVARPETAAWQHIAKHMSCGALNLYGNFNGTEVDHDVLCSCTAQPLAASGAG